MSPGRTAACRYSTRCRLRSKPGLTAVIGPNGSGKSTLLGGARRRDGADSREVRHPARPGQSRSVPPQRVPFREGFTARETLAFYARLVGDDPDAALDGSGSATPAIGASRRSRRHASPARHRAGGPATPRSWSSTSRRAVSTRGCARAFRAAADQADGDTAVVVSRPRV